MVCCLHVELYSGKTYRRLHSLFADQTARIGDILRSRTEPVCHMCKVNCPHEVLLKELQTPHRPDSLQAAQYVAGLSSIQLQILTISGRV